MKHGKKRTVCLLCVLLIFPVTAKPVCSATGKADVRQVIEDILAYKCRSTGAADIGALIDGDLTANAGVTADWYIFGLKQYGYSHDYTGFSDSLKRFAEKNEVPSPVTEERMALLFACLGTEPDYISRVTDSAIGALGVMSLVYGLHLLNNGYSSRATDKNAVVSELLGMQKADGGWAVMGDYGDVDVTAMTLAALAPYYKSNGDVRAAVDRGLALLSDRQTENGGFKAFGQESPESAAQVIVALTSLGVDPLTAPDFIKNGHTAFDAMLTFRLSDGSFEHTPGKGPNHTATVQAFYSSVALWRYLNGQPGLYVLRSAGPEITTEMPPVTEEPTEKPAPATTKAAVPTTAPATEPTVQTTSVTTTAAPQSTTHEPSVVTSEPEQAVSVIRPEKSATLPDFGTTKTTDVGTATDAAGERAPRLAIGVGVTVGAAVVAAAVILLMMKKRKTAA